MLRASLGLLLACACAAAPVPRGRDFWLGLKASGFAVPADGGADAIFTDSEALLGLADPELRDEVGYGLSEAWLVRRPCLSREALDHQLPRLVRRMTAFDAPGPDAVLGRSFAALRLSLLVAADLEHPALSVEQLDALVEASSAALTRESDLRGYQPGLGWVHATAHVADLMKFLARHPRLAVARQRTLAEAVLRRLERGPAFAWGEDERLAQVLRRLALRPDAALEPLQAWLAARPAAWQALWTAPALDEVRYTALNNQKLTLRALLLYLDAEERPTAAVEALRRTVLEVSAQLL